VEIVVTMVIVTPGTTVIPLEADPVAPGTLVLVTVTMCPATVVVLDGFKLVCAAIVIIDDNGEAVAVVTELVMFGRMTPTPPYGRVIAPESQEVALPTTTTVGVTQEVRVNVKMGVT